MYHCGETTYRSQAGFTLIELVVSLSLLGLLVVGLGAMSRAIRSEQALLEEAVSETLQAENLSRLILRLDEIACLTKLDTRHLEYIDGDGKHRAVDLSNWQTPVGEGPGSDHFRFSWEPQPGAGDTSSGVLRLVPGRGSMWLHSYAWNVAYRIGGESNP